MYLCNIFHNKYSSKVVLQRILETLVSRYKQQMQQNRNAPPPHMLQYYLPSPESRMKLYISTLYIYDYVNVKDI